MSSKFTTRAGATQAIIAAFTAYALTASLGTWRASDWWWILRAPFLAGAALGVAAWLTHQKSSIRTPAASQVTALLVLSGTLDVVVGPLSPGAAWSTGLAWATWFAVGAVLVRGMLHHEPRVHL